MDNPQVGDTLYLTYPSSMQIGVIVEVRKYFYVTGPYNHAKYRVKVRRERGIKETIFYLPDKHLGLRRGELFCTWK